MQGVSSFAGAEDLLRKKEKLMFRVALGSGIVPRVAVEKGAHRCSCHPEPFGFAQNRLREGSEKWPKSAIWRFIPPQAEPQFCNNHLSHALFFQRQHHAFEHLELGILAPGIGGQPCFLAEVCKCFFLRPTLFGSDFRQKNRARQTQAQDNSVLT